MAGASIEKPGVTVTQEFVATNPTVVTPRQQTVLVGPCFQVVSALDDLGKPIPAARAGSYRDGFGTVAYDLPGLKPFASPAGFTTAIRVFLALGSQIRELHGVSDEVEVYAGTTASIDGSDFTDLVLTDPGVNFVLEGIEAGDFVRFTFQGESFDVEIATVSATQLGLDETSAVAELSPHTFPGALPLSLSTYSVVRNPPEFVYVDAISNASVSKGAATDYLTIRVRSDAPAEWLGSGGDDIAVNMSPQPAYVTEAAAYVGANIFWAIGDLVNFTSAIGAVGVVTNRFLFIGAAGAGNALREILRVITDDILIIENGATAGLTNQNYVAGSVADTGTNGATGGGDETAFTSAGQNFNTSIPNTGGTPNTATYIEIAGVGVFAVSAVVSDTALTIGAGAGAGLSAQTYTVITQTATGSGKGYTGKDNSGGQSTVCFSHGGLTSDLLTGHAVITDAGGTWEGGAFASSPGEAALDTHLVHVTADLTATFTAQAAKVVGVSTNAVWQWEPEDKVLTFLAGRGTNGLTRGGLAAGSGTGIFVVESLSDDEDPAYNETVASIFEAIESGDLSSAAFTEADLLAGNYNSVLDGGADAGQLLLDQDLLGSVTPTALVYVSYKALRLDVTPAAGDDTLFYELGSVDDVTTFLGDLPDNPLAIAAYAALLNSPGTPIRALGVSAVSAAKPFGTPEAYSQAFDFLAAKKVYTLVALTQDQVVIQALKAHVVTMSEPEQKSERIGFGNLAMPTHRAAEVIASGTTGNTETVAGEGTAEFAASVDFALAEAEAGDILVVTSRADAQTYLESVDGTVGPLYGVPITGIKTGDDFVLEFVGTDIPSSWNNMVDVSWTLYRPGAAISIPADQAETIAKLGEAYAERRLFLTWPDTVIGPVDGTSTVLQGFYAAAAVGGLINAKKPAQGLTNSSLAGFDGLRHSNGYFTPAHLDRMAGGGIFILEQTVDGGPLSVRHQLSTDTSSIEKREQSVTQANDYIAEVFRVTLGPQIGSANITDNLLTDIAGKCEGLATAIVEQGQARSVRLLSVSENEVEADALDIEIGVRNFLPNNYNRVKLKIGGA